MRFTWDPDAYAWTSVIAGSGPAGAVPTSAGAVWLEFDRIDCGRLVKLMIPVDVGVEDEGGGRLFGSAWSMLGRPGAQDWETADVDLSDTPLWTFSRELARSAQLAEDADRLEHAGYHEAAAIASAELAQVLHGLAELAPGSAELELGRMAGHLRGRPRVDRIGTEAVRELANHLIQWAPSAYAQSLRTLGDPIVVLTGQPTRVQPLAYAGGPTQRAGEIDWRTENTGDFAVAFGLGTGKVHWGQYDAATVTITSDQPLGEMWITVWADSVLLAEGPMRVSGPIGVFQTGPLSARPTSAVAVGHPYRTRAHPLSQMDTAVRLGRRAVDLEQREHDSTADAWRECAEAWLAVDEVGRAAIALDRAADAAIAGGQPTRARHDRQRARALATPWARPFLDGRSGTPYRTVWRRAVGNAVPAFDGREPSG